jgi:hypothetical protein
MKVIAVEFVDNQTPVMVFNSPALNRRKRRLWIGIISFIAILLIIVAGVGAMKLIADRKKIDINLSSTSSIVLKGDSYVTSFTDQDSSLSNVTSNGHNIYYDKDNEANSWLDGKTVELNGGGKLVPYNSWL